MDTDRQARVDALKRRHALMRLREAQVDEMVAIVTQVENWMRLGREGDARVVSERLDDVEDLKALVREDMSTDEGELTIRGNRAIDKLINVQMRMRAL